jgi:hypothetical protein
MHSGQRRDREKSQAAPMLNTIEVHIEMNTIEVHIDAAANSMRAWNRLVVVFPWFHKLYQIIVP